MDTNSKLIQALKQKNADLIKIAAAIKSDKDTPDWIKWYIEKELKDIK